MAVAAKAKQTAPVRPKQPAELIREWAPIVRSIDPMAELDFSFAQDAITICDMTVPNALRYGVLFSRHNLEDNLHKIPGELERRVRAFMARG